MRPGLHVARAQGCMRNHMDGLRQRGAATRQPAAAATSSNQQQLRCQAARDALSPACRSFPRLRPRTLLLLLLALLQVVFEPASHPEASKTGARLRSEWVVAVTGTLRARKDPNTKIPTGTCLMIQLLVS